MRCERRDRAAGMSALPRFAEDSVCSWPFIVSLGPQLDLKPVAIILLIT